MKLYLTDGIDREEVTKEERFDFSNDIEDEDDDLWDNVADWDNENDEAEEDVKDESTAYLEFLNEEVCRFYEYPGEVKSLTNDRLKSLVLLTPTMMTLLKKTIY